MSDRRIAPKDLSQWEPQAAGKAWKIEKGYVEVVGGGGDLVNKEKFGDAQIHAEWAAPAEILGADGQAGAIYGQWPPLVNAWRKPGGHRAGCSSSGGKDPLSP